MEPLWDNTDRRGSNYLERNLSQCHFFHHKSHMDRTGDEHVRPQGEAGDYPLTTTLPLFLGRRSRVLLISIFRRVLYVVCFILRNFPASKFYMPTFRNTLSIPADGPDSVPKCRHIKFRRRGITQKKTYNTSVSFFVLRR
jgi:hypothetical protein